MQVFFGLFKSEKDIIESFNVEKNVLDNLDVLFAYYSYEDYSGDAMVILKDKTTHQLYEVNGGHCSCHGLENQWMLEETTLEDMMKRDYPFFNEVVKAHISKYLLNKELKEITNNKASRNKFKI